MIQQQELDALLEPTGWADVHLLRTDDPEAFLQQLAAGEQALIGGLPVTAAAPHPAMDDAVYVTTGHPDLFDQLYDVVEPP